jgi:putative hydrolase of the HAD superfamily
VTDQAHRVLGERPLDLDEFVAFDWLYHAGIHWPVVHHIRHLRAAGYRLGMLTNNVAEWREAWRSTIPVAELFHDVVDSSEVGVCKPDPAIYHLACERLGVAPAVAVFLDDTERNVEGARAVGMRGILVGADPGEALDELDRLLAEEGAPPLPNPSG